jgi:hypothetical protein
MSVSTVFNGQYELIYPDHIDQSTGKTLVAVPGQSYITQAAPGRNSNIAAIPDDGRWSSNYAVAASVTEEKEEVTTKDAVKAADTDEGVEISG